MAKLFEKIADIKNFSGVVWFAVVFLTAVFAGAVIVSFVLSHGRRYASAVKKAIKLRETGIPYFEALQKLPPIIKKRYDAFLAEGGRAELHLSVEQCVDIPLKRGWHAFFEKIMVFAALAAATAVFAAGDAVNSRMSFYIYPVVTYYAAAVLLLGFLYALLLAVLVKIDYNALLKYHYLLIDLLNGITAAKPEPARDDDVIETYAAAAFIPCEPEPVYPSHIDVATPAEEPVPAEIVREPVPVKAVPKTKPGPKPKTAAPKPAPEAETPAPKSEPKPESKPEKIKAEKPKAEPKPAPSPEPKTEKPKAKTEPKPAASESKLNMSAATADVLKQIDDVCDKGGSQSQFRALSVKLKLERAKPENKSPEMQQTLDEAMKKLLSVMANS